MKRKLILFVVLAVMCIAFVSCAANQNIIPTTIPTTLPITQVPGTSENTPSLPETIPTEPNNETPPTTSTPESTLPTTGTVPTEPTEPKPKPTEPPHVHEYKETNRTEATCTAEGEITYQCECGDEIHERLPKIEHTYAFSDEIKSTCVKEGYLIYACQCGCLKYERLPLEKHQYSQSEICEATCTQEGYIRYTCVCGDFKNETLPKTKHQYVLNEVEPATCTKEGKDIQRCKCGDAIIEIIPKKAHQPKEHHRVEATCTKEGKITYRCECGYEEYKSISKTKHEYKLVTTVESTTTVKGYKEYKCVSCTSTYKEELPLKKGALYTDMCGASLFGKALNTEYKDFFAAILARASNPPTQKEAMKGDPRLPNSAENYPWIKIPDGLSTRDIINKIREYYIIFDESFPYTIYTLEDDIPEKGSYFLFWKDSDSPDEWYNTEAEVKRILKELGIDTNTTQYDAMWKINNYLCEMKEYDDNRVGEGSGPVYSLTGKLGVCHHYAVAFQALCRGAGIECYYYSSQTMNHAWNKVVFSDGTYRWVDVCWNDARYKLNGVVINVSTKNGLSQEKVDQLRSRYFLITTEQLLKDHSL